MKIQNKDEESVLHVAAANGKTEIASVLSKLGNSSDKNSLISSPDNDVITAFHCSCSVCHVEFSKWKLEKYKNCKSVSDPLLHTIQDIEGNAPLITAVLSNRLEIVSWLFNNDPACMKIQNKYNQRVLTFAAANGKMKLLLFS